MTRADLLPCVFGFNVLAWPCGNRLRATGRSSTTPTTRVYTRWTSTHPNPEPPATPQKRLLYAPPAQQAPHRSVVVCLMRYGWDGELIGCADSPRGTTEYRYDPIGQLFAQLSE